MSFFDQFDEASWEFTYGDECNPELTVLQVGLVAIFHIDEGWREEKRRAIAEAIERYIQDYGDRLCWGFIDNVNRPELFIKGSKDNRIQRLIELEDGAAEILWGSSSGRHSVSDYQIDMFSPAGWFEYIHHPVSYVRFYLPISELKMEGGKERFERLILDFCTLLKPMHGLAGLGLQQIYEHEKFQHLEYEIGQAFNGIDMTNPYGDKQYRDGITSVNWYTFFDNGWLTKLGGQQALLAAFDKTDITLLPYEGGMVVRAGEWPELGWIEKDPYPDLYVKVNQALRPIRAPKLDSMGYGSNAGEIRFDERSTACWLARFDNAPQLNVSAPPKSVQSRLITAKTAEPCPHTGFYGSGFPLEYATVQQSFPMPPRENGNPTTWTLIKRADGGPISVEGD
ncbi:Protein of uncharacterised function (DUF3396) [Leminorella richardii]|uniref:Protein of uncharacterized function (DUF3396) n=1 Tax=Leminorella richardii TaxID=158841 RepID=A0A2X4U821_9GAMM|nr:type VI immunity family protein [Leminorella richardii]SQI35956.1 Protein of uncharacterised function (DUF3396) [Leminorella richardii]